MPTRVLRALGLVASFVVALGLLSSPAMAVTVSNLDGIAVGAAVAPSLTNEIIGGGSPPEDHGALTTDVFQLGSAYLYEFTIAPKVTSISAVSTSFSGGITGFNGVAGYSFGQADAAAGAGGLAAYGIPGLDASTVFSATLASGNLLFQVNPLASANCPPGPCYWATADPSNPGFYLPITFFFESTSSPIIGTGTYSTGPYSQTNQFTGAAIGYAPAAAVPEPTTLLLLSSAFVGVGFVSRWRRSEV